VDASMGKYSVQRKCIRRALYIVVGGKLYEVVGRFFLFLREMTLRWQSTPNRRNACAADTIISEED